MNSPKGYNADVSVSASEFVWYEPTEGRSLS